MPLDLATLLDYHVATLIVNSFFQKLLIVYVMLINMSVFLATKNNIPSFSLLYNSFYEKKITFIKFFSRVCNTYKIQRSNHFFIQDIVRS